MASAAETIAHETREHSSVLRAEFDALRDQIQELELLALRERVKVLEEQNAQHSKKAEDADKLRELVAVLKAEMAELKKAKEESDKQSVRAAVTDDRVSKLEKKEEESGKRQWQFVYIAAGAGFALLSSFLVQLVFYFLKK